MMAASEKNLAIRQERMPSTKKVVRSAWRGRNCVCNRVPDLRTLGLNVVRDEEDLASGQQMRRYRSIGPILDGRPLSDYCGVSLGICCGKDCGQQHENK